MTILKGNMYIAVCAALSCGITWTSWATLASVLTANGCLLYFFGILFEALLGMDMDDVRETNASNGHGDGSKHVDRKVHSRLPSIIFQGRTVKLWLRKPPFISHKKAFWKGNNQPYHTIFRDENILTMVINRVTSTWKLEWLNFPCIVLWLYDIPLEIATLLVSKWLITLVRKSPIVC